MGVDAKAMGQSRPSNAQNEQRIELRPGSKVKETIIGSAYKLEKSMTNKINE